MRLGVLVSGTGVDKMQLCSGKDRGFLWQIELDHD